MVDIRRAWEKTWDPLKEKLGNTTFETWILPLRPKSKDAQKFVLEAPDNFFRHWVQQHYQSVIQEVIQSVINPQLVVELETAPQTKEILPKPPPQELPKTQDLQISLT